MTELKISLSNDLAKKMEEYPKINWSSVVKKAIKNVLKNLEYHEDAIPNEQLEMVSEHSFKAFLDKEPDIYTDEDLVERYK
ncbi:MAG: hypothetical protein BAJALOKI1v1_2590004 [Promethearchaeota archaeon]|nr:MAG: hypothetical protein BAJALOKI1v1_2590004 [Candidatus Lokiarchaeota archaeon]